MKRLQHRISLDPAMGQLYDWLCTLDPATRAREVVYLVRLGAEVHLGARSLHLAGGNGRVGEPALAGNRTEERPAQEDGLVNMDPWNLADMVTPPRRLS